MATDTAVSWIEAKASARSPDLVLRRAGDGCQHRHRNRTVFARVAQGLDEARKLLVCYFVCGGGEAAQRSGDRPAHEDRRGDRERRCRERKEAVGEDVPAGIAALRARLREQARLDVDLDIATEIESL